MNEKSTRLEIQSNVNNVRFNSFIQVQFLFYFRYLSSDPDQNGVNRIKEKSKKNPKKLVFFFRSKNADTPKNVVCSEVKLNKYSTKLKTSP
jgi:hypothetical protein